jgi:VWFA-related protein
MKRLLPALLLFGTARLGAQQPFPQEGPAVKFHSSTQLVVEIVTVKDRNGKSIEGLTGADFTVTENGVPQTIRFCEFQRLDERQDPEPVRPVQTAGAEPVTRNQIAPEKQGEFRYRGRRLLTLYFDMTSMPVPDQFRALAAAQRFIRTQMARPDLMAIMKFAGGAVQVLQDFTDDRDLLLTAIKTMMVGEGQGFDENPSDDSAADTGSAFGQDDGEFNIFNTDRHLAALQTAAAMLGHLNEKKSLIYFASGLRLNGTSNQAQLRAATNAAIRANVSIYPVDARGLVAEAPLGDASKGSPGGIGMYTGGSALAAATGFQRSQDTLYALGADTGGKALLDNNDLALGIVQAQKAVSSYYVIGYYTSNTALDGKFRKISISLKDTTAKLDYRAGYFAGKEFGKFTSADKERQLEDALMLGDPITDLTIVMEIAYFQLNRAEYFVPLAVKIPGSELSLARRRGAEHTRIDFIGEIKDEYGTTITNVRDKIDIKLSGETASQLARRPIAYDTAFTLLPGAYTVKFLARDEETGRIGTYQTKFVIPNLNKEEKRIPISSVVLSSQRVDQKDALYTAGKNKTPEQNPLVQDGQKLIPSVTRVFSKSRDMYVYLQAYDPAASQNQPLVAFVTFYRGQHKAFETPPLPVTERSANRLRTAPLRFSLGLDKLPAGRYDCQVTVLDPATQKAAFWQTPVMLIP